MSKSYRNSVTLSAQNGVLADSSRFGHISFDVYNPQSSAIEVFVTLKCANGQVTLVSSVARPEQWTKISLQLASLGSFDMDSLQSVTIAFSPMEELNNFDLFIDNLTMTVRGEV